MCKTTSVSNLINYTDGMNLTIWKIYWMGKKWWILMREVSCHFKREVSCHLWIMKYIVNTTYGSNWNNFILFYFLLIHKDRFVSQWSTDRKVFICVLFSMRWVFAPSFCSTHVQNHCENSRCKMIVKIHTFCSKKFT